MQSDLIVGAALILILALMMFCCAVVLSRRAGHGVVVSVVVGTIALLGVFLLCLHGRLALARLLPFSNVIVVGNWVPVGVGVLAGIALGNRRAQRWRRVVLFVVLVGLGLFSLFRPLVRSAPPIGNAKWTESRVCLQSSPASCSPCAAATLLDHHGIASSEAELVRLCLTDHGGTPTLGLYRGLMLKTRGTSFSVDLVAGNPVAGDVASLVEADRWPVLLLCRLPEESHPDFQRVRAWGWTPGAGHAVVVFGRMGNGGFAVGDPMVGRQLWTPKDMKTLWSGRGFCLHEEP